MADQPTTTTRATPRRTISRPIATGASTTRATRTARPTNQGSRSVTRVPRSSAAVSDRTSTLAALPTSSSAPESAGGPSGAVIGGIAAGAAMMFALVGLLFYKRRKRATVATADVRGGSKGDLPTTSTALSTNNTISGPMSLAPDDGIEAAPAHRPEAHFREQQQFRPGMRDELFAQPGSAIHKTLTERRENNSNSGNPKENALVNNNGYLNEKELYSGNKESLTNSIYDHNHLVDDYFEGPDNAAVAPSIGAQRPAPQPKDPTHGNLTPAPEYYLGKEDIDPRRDLRGLDKPEAYVKKASPMFEPDQAQPSGNQRSSSSSDGDSAYLTLEQAQQAHNNKMMGHKQSIGSAEALMANQHTNDRLKNNGSAPPDHLLSVAMTESTVSMMPALSPAAGPLPSQRPGPPNRGLVQGPMSPTSPHTRGREDPYAESAYSEDYLDDRSLASGSYYNPHYAGQQHSPQYHQHHSSPYSSQPISPPYSQQGYPQQGYGPVPYNNSYNHGYSHGHGYNNNGYNSNGYSGYNGNNRSYPGSPSFPNSQPLPHHGPGIQRDGPYQRQY
ncbi:hypothetical protein BX616_006536 [Lobosporangium transversale]|uniref:Uncharacterized protein n=1 Tax=Lobosporangium transversale TaxID=64571 RepID=A0A1Y2GYY9_9FUNG|nr:hypothetical protein BCR41DRAFT_346922 [Lobosporangium transversale]KAF9915269.1 hypothetical protein BX616_006536 [Lobosporangium transversale]ORZ27518.1 hypothetical protein BCR41DRAFT_346922 [Lobosporangium transversale]|eukprot:XP_021885245.1 hypothetical protein BCR41DRAFT_346922 [Lobosporangium transversale]